MNAVANDDAVVELGAELRGAVGRVYRRFRSERDAGALGDTALTVLARLHTYGPQTLSQLSETYRVSPASMSQTVNRLASAGYAVRTDDPSDGRKVLLQTTTAGAELAATDLAHRNAWLHAQLSELSDAERRTLRRAAELLETIARS